MRHQMNLHYIHGRFVPKCECGWTGDGDRKSMLAQLEYAEHFKTEVPES